MAVPRQKSASVLHRRSKDRKSSDERVRRTRARIDSAFVELLHRRAYGSIRVSDITRKARVGRATFYAHYSDKDDLLRSQFERIVAPMLSISKAPALLDATAFFDHVRNVRFIYQALMGPAGGSAPRVLRQCFERRARKALSFERSTKVGLEGFAASRLVASAIITVAECWMEQGFRETPQQVQALFANLISEGVHR